MAKKNSSPIRSWLPVAVWLGWIFFASTDLLSAEHTSRFLVPFLHWLDPNISPQAIAYIHFGIRKCAHLTEYGILAVLLWRAIHQQSAKWGTRFALAAALALVLATFFAAIDEFHQSFIPSRTSSSGDVLIDGCGAFVGLLLCWWAERLRLRRARRRA